MPLITQSVSKDYLEMYDGYDQQKVGMGLIEPSVYATPQYQKKKIKNLMIGGISEISYGGSEHDRTPLILTMAYNPVYNTVIAYNLHYAPPVLRKAILKFVLESNAARIKSNLPIIVDYYALKKQIPDSQYIVRMYKVVGISVFNTIPLVEWPNAVKDPSKWSNHYKLIKEGRVK